MKKKEATYRIDLKARKVSAELRAVALVGGEIKDGGVLRGDVEGGKVPKDARGAVLELDVVTSVQLGPVAEEGDAAGPVVAGVGGAVVVGGVLDVGVVEAAEE